MANEANTAIEKFDLKGHRLFKMSHGYFKKGDSWDSGIIELLETKKWISIYRETGKSQGDKFINHAEIGDYVYVCYGGDDLVCFGRITSDAKPFDETTDEMIGGDGMWVYREIEPLKMPLDRSVRDLKKYRKFHMPSGNSTFYELSAGVLDQANKDLFIPKFGFEIVDTGRGVGDVMEPPPISGESGPDDFVKHPLNQILYGPPGTGKTFHSISRAVAIIEGEEVETIIQECEDGNRDEVKKRFDNYVSKGRVQFCTFHQSMSYEDFIEGIKPVLDVSDGRGEESMMDEVQRVQSDLNYEIRDGIFKKLCKTAYKNFFTSDKNALDENDDDAAEPMEDGVPAGPITPPALGTIPLTTDLDEIYDQFIIYVGREFKSKNNNNTFGEYKLDAKFKRICIMDIGNLANTPATISAKGPNENANSSETIQLLFLKELFRYYNIQNGKSASSKDFHRFSLAERKRNADPNLMANIQTVLRGIADSLGKDQAYFSRPNVGYGLYLFFEDFAYNYAKNLKSGVTVVNQESDSDTIPPSRPVLLGNPISDSKPSIQNFVLIIDEINRGNVSQVFGELITLLEEDKRLDNQEALEAVLPYSQTKFGVPSNVHIIGTMNTADRSVEALDTALRRRFTFVPMMPEEGKLKTTNDGIDLERLLLAMNSRLKLLKDNDHTIGHAWLMGIVKLEELCMAFGNKILPLLQEYFYNDYEKLGLVLGDKFFGKAEQVSSKIFASFKSGNDLASQYDQAWQYKLKDPMELSVADFQSLYA